MTGIVFFGSNQYSVIILKALLAIPDFQVIAVVTKPDAPVGREQKITGNPVSEFSKKNNLKLLQPPDFDSAFIQQFCELKPDLALCVAYGPPFFTSELINIPKYKIINLHPSPLPKYRGATPGPWQIINGETKSALSFFVIDEKPDHGPLITQIPFNITPTETSTTFYEKAFSLGAQSLETVLKNYLQNPQKLTEQDHSQKSYYPKLTKESGKIDWSKSPDSTERFIRAMHPWPLAWTEVKDPNNQVKRVQILSSHLENGKLILGLVKIEGKTESSWKNLQSHYQLV